MAPAGGAARAATQLAKNLNKRAEKSKKSGGEKTKGEHRVHHHEHHEPHLPPGVVAGDWEKLVHEFSAEGATVVRDAEVVKGWSVVMVAAWIASINHNDFEEYADNFLKHHIDGPMLLKINEGMLEEVGIGRISDRIKLADILSQMQRRCNKPETQKIQVPSWPMCFLEQLTFAWADTSEGKTGSEMQEELVQANSSIALVSTLTWAMAWDLLFGSATSCFCPTDAGGNWDTTDIDACFCSTAWDMEGRPLAIFYCFSGLSCMLFLLSTIYAVIQIMMVYEMSDEEEVDTFMSLLQSDAQLPGLFLFLGMICFCVPIGVYLIYTVNLGIIPGPSNRVQLVFSYLAACFALAVTIFGFFYQIPKMISGVYEAKLNVIRADFQPLWLPQFASTEQRGHAEAPQ